ncbi:MAG: heat-inducible transcriptional repressor HrcA [Desulfobacteraceae bacterium]|nr:heat-inducible transcriptional repressor HrcA [Desulfobacteraceae bacterium]
MSRQKNPDIEISERGQGILRAIINKYISEAEPIGSKTVSKNCNFGLSPATIRNIMADLEEMGLLVQPHTSAGRLPTEAGIRYYINHLLERESLSWGDQVAIEEGLLRVYDDLSAILARTAQMLAAFSGHAAIVSVPRADKGLLKHIEFISIKPGLVLVVTVSDSGIIQNRLAKVEGGLSQERLEKFSSCLNGMLDRCRDLKEARDTIMQELQEEKRLFDVLINDLMDRHEQDDAYGDFFIDGRRNLLDQPEFSQIGRLRAILQTLEEKKNLVVLLDKCLDSNGARIFIGSEAFGDKNPSCGVVLASYSAVDQPVGTLGVVGPMRMNYARIIPLVEYTAQILSERFKES